MDHALEGKELGWSRAIECLATPDGEVNVAARRKTALWLKEVLDRLGQPAPIEIPGPRSLDEQSLSRYRYFPSPRHAWVWEQLAQPPSGRIELMREESGAWLFTPETCEQAQALWESTAALPPQHEPDRTAAEFGGLLSQTWEGTRPAAWAALAGCIALGALSGFALRRGLHRLGRWAARRDLPVWSSILDDVGSPLALAAGTGGLALGLRFLHLRETLGAFAQGVLTFLTVLTAGWLLINLADLPGQLVRRFTSARKGGPDIMLAPLLTKSLRVLLVAMIAIIVLERVLGVNVTGFLAGVGLIGLALSLAAKDSFQNLFGALTIFLEQPFQVGDVIRFNGSFGTVTSIGLRATQLRLLNGDQVFQPNMSFITDKIENVSTRPHIRRKLELTLPYNTPASKVEEAVTIVRDLLTDSELAESGNFPRNLPARVSFNEFNDWSLNLRAYYWYGIENVRDSGWYDYLDHCQAVNVAILRRFGEAGIEFAFPTQTLHLQGDASDEEEARAPAQPDGERDSGPKRTGASPRVERAGSAL